MEKGLRYNEGKLRYDLIPPEALRALAEVLTMGAKKYAARNWELGLPFDDTVASLMRHLVSYQLGEKVDLESNHSHLKHVLWNAMALVVMEERGKWDEHGNLKP